MTPGAAGERQGLTAGRPPSLGRRHPTVPTWYTYRQLSAMWHHQSDTIQRWLIALRRTAPDRVHMTYKLVGGLRRTLLIRGDTALELANRHMPDLGPTTYQVQPRRWRRDQRPGTPAPAIRSDEWGRSRAVAKSAGPGGPMDGSRWFAPPDVFAQQRARELWALRVRGQILDRLLEATLPVREADRALAAVDRVLRSPRRGRRPAGKVGGSTAEGRGPGPGHVYRVRWPPL